MRSLWATILAAFCLFGGLAGCADPQQALATRLQDEDPAVRLHAIHQVGQAKDARMTPYLVDRLTDTEPEVRFFAILALERLTGTRRGYSYLTPPKEQEEAVQRWRQWLKDQHTATAASEPTEGSRS